MDSEQKPSIANSSSSSPSIHDERQDISPLLNLFSTVLNITNTSSALEQASSWNETGDFHKSIFEESRKLVDLDLALSAYKQAIQFTPEDHPNFRIFLYDVANSLRIRFEVGADPDDIEQAVSMHKIVLHLMPERDDNIPVALTGLGNSLMRRYEHTKDPEDIGDAISALRLAVHLTPELDEEMPLVLNDLGNSILRRFELAQDKDPADIDEAISAYSRALRILPDGHPRIPNVLRMLGNAHIIRFDHYGNAPDIEHSISLYRQSIISFPNGHPGVPEVYHHLGDSLYRRFESNNSSGLQDIDLSISSHRKAVSLTPQIYSLMPAILYSLQKSLSSRFFRTGDSADIDDAVSTCQKCISLTPNDHTSRSTRLLSLGELYRIRFDHSSVLSDIDMAISTYESAIDDISEDAPNYLGLLFNIGSAHLSRFTYTNDPEDMALAIPALQEAASLAHTDNPNRPVFLNGLGHAYMTLIEYGGDVSQVKDAIVAHQEAVDLTTIGNATDKAERLSALGASFGSLFRSSHNSSDLESAIVAHRQAVDLLPEDHPLPLSRALSNLANALEERSEHAKNLHDIDEAISFKQKAINLVSTGRYKLGSMFIGDLGRLFHLRFKQSHNPSDLKTALSHLRNAAKSPTSSASIRLRDTSKWASCSRSSEVSQSLEAYGVAFELLPQVAWLGQPIATRHSRLAGVSHIPREAAATAISAGKYSTALEWLEQGRCMVLSQLSYLRAPLEYKNLLASQPRLAAEFMRLAKALDHAGSRTALENYCTFGERMTVQGQVRTNHKLAKEWEDLIKKIRGTPGFERFLKPVEFSDILNTAPPNPVVIINVEHLRCDALVLMPHGTERVIHIPLERFSYKQAEDLNKLLSQCLSSEGLRMREARKGRPAPPEQPKARRIKYILSELWDRVAKPILDTLKYSPSSNPPRLWWCPTGPLSFLPIHAAGIYEESTESGPGYTTISDFVISSYTPTLSVILDINDEFQNLPTFTGVLHVGLPNTPNLQPLPGVMEEMHCIQKLLDLHSLDAHNKSSFLEGQTATIKAVLEGMEVHSWVHLACHASQDVGTPMKSGFHLQDGCLELSELFKTQFRHADFAFLSACQTCTGHETLSEEAVHLAAGMLSAGYRSVIASMWSINDAYAPFVAEKVYEHLFDTGKRDIDSSRSAYALHYAVKNLRDRLGDGESELLLWIPYVHFGL